MGWGTEKGWASCVWNNSFFFSLLDTKRKDYPKCWSTWGQLDYPTATSDMLLLDLPPLGYQLLRRLSLRTVSWLCWHCLHRLFHAHTFNHSPLNSQSPRLGWATGLYQVRGLCSLAMCWVFLRLCSQRSSLERPFPLLLCWQ